MTIKGYRNWRRSIDRKMGDSGEIDYEEKKIRINPSKTKKGGILDSVLHEELHRVHPDWTEVKIRREAKRRLAKMSINSTIKMLKRYKKGK